MALKIRTTGMQHTVNGTETVTLKVLQADGTYVDYEVRRALSREKVTSESRRQGTALLDRMASWTIWEEELPAGVKPKINDVIEEAVEVETTSEDATVQWVIERVDWSLVGRKYRMLTRRIKKDFS